MTPPGPGGGPTVIFRFDEYELDSGRYELRRRGEPVALEPKSLDVLLQLVRERHRLVSKQELLDAVWTGVHVTESTLTRAVSLARAAIGDSAQEPRAIETVAGRGYRWKAPVEVVESAIGGAPPARPARRPRTRAALSLGAAALALAGLVALSWPGPVGWLLALTGSGVPPGSPGLPAEPSVVVLPFRDLSPAGGHAFLADGIGEDLTFALGRFPALFVISRSSALTYQASDVPIETIGRELGVRYAVQGSVRAAGDQLVVTSQLVDARSGVQVWAERIDTRLDDALAVQGRLAEQIVGALGTRIESAELERLRDLATDDLDAYELYVRARGEFWRYTRASHARAHELLARALELDPEYSHAVSLEAALELAPHLLGWEVSLERVERARGMAVHAVEVDPLGPLPRTTLALALMSAGRFGEALEEARRAVTLGPNSDVCLGVQAAALSEAGHPLEALRSLDRALRLNPRHPQLYWLMAGLLNAEVGRRELGYELIERVRESNPEMVPPRLVLAYQYYGDGDVARVEELGREIRGINPALTIETALGILPFVRRNPERAEHARSALRAAGLP
jgi:TolB-like protein/DNA-binding winged helix-turn-helix (wHTH) protein